MNLKPFFINCVIVLVFIFLGYSASQLIGNILIGESDPSWNKHLLPVPPEKIVDIVYLQLSTSASEDPIGDSIFVEAANGKIYSYTLFQNDWLPISTDPTYQKKTYFTQCAKEWVDHSELSRLNQYAPTEKIAIDSMGLNWFNAPSTSVARCYILLEDGNIQVWTYSGNVEDLIENRSLKKWFMMLGTITGIFLSFFVIRYKTRMLERAKTSTPATPLAGIPQFRKSIGGSERAGQALARD